MRKLWKIKRFPDTSKEKPNMRLIARRWLVLVTASMGLYLVLPERGLAQNNQGQNDQGINLVVPNGTYAFRDTGQVTLPGSTTPILIAAAGRITFIPTGTINGQVIGKTRGVLTASINGQISPITINGSFSVNPDGSVFEIEQQTGGPNALLHFTDYPTPDGNTITFVATDPGSIVSGITTR